MEEDLAKEEEEGAGCDIGPELPDSLAFSLAELPGRIRHSAGGLINVRYVGTGTSTYSTRTRLCKGVSEI